VKELALLTDRYDTQLTSLPCFAYILGLLMLIWFDSQLAGWSSPQLLMTVAGFPAAH
jgi:hypothetical protein